MHSDDLARLNLVHDQVVTVVSKAGSLGNIHARAFDEIRSGNALMYYPECNILVSRHSDPQSRTPAFKGVVVEISV